LSDQEHILGLRGNDVREILINNKVVILGGIIILAQLAVYSILWLNPYVESITAQFTNSPSVKSYEYFGGLDNWMKLRTIYNAVILALLIKLFLMFYEKLPGTGWVKGIWFGLIISAIKVIPEAFNKWTLIVYPDQLILLQLVNGTLGLVIFGLLLSTVFLKAGVVSSPNNNE